MAKNIRPEVNNPLANMGLDEIVRGITAPDKVKKPDTGASEVQDIQKEGKRRRKGRKALEENLAKYTGVRVNAKRNIPLRSLAAAIIMTYIEENEENFNEL